MMLVEASISGHWFPNSGLALARAERRRRDVDGLYARLGIQPTASEAEIRSAAKRLMLENHPDTGGDEESFIAVREAYETLSDPAARFEYDNREAAGIELRVRRVAAPGPEPPSQPAFYKDARDVLADEEVARVRQWQDMLLETAREFGAALVIKAGIVSKIPPGYSKDISLIEKDEVPVRWKAKLLILRGMIENG